MISSLFLGFASDSCNNKDIILILGYNYNISTLYTSVIQYNHTLCRLRNLCAITHTLDIIVILIEDKLGTLRPAVQLPN